MYHYIWSLFYYRNVIWCYNLLSEISLVETDEACTMASFVFSHFVNSIVSSIHTCCLGILSNTELVFASTTLSLDTCSKIALSIFQYITKQLCKLTCVLSFFKSITLESLCNFWISFANSGASEGSVISLNLLRGALHNGHTSGASVPS